jgi:hypothetical protein
LPKGRSSTIENGKYPHATHDPASRKRPFLKRKEVRKIAKMTKRKDKINACPHFTFSINIHNPAKPPYKKAAPTRQLSFKKMDQNTKK